MSDHADVIRYMLSWIHTHPDLSMEFQRYAEKHLDALVAERDEWKRHENEAVRRLAAAEAERDSWRTLAEGWKLTDDVRKSSAQ